MSKDIFQQLDNMLSMTKSMYKTTSEKMEKQAKEAEAYEDEFKKKNKMYKAFCRLNLKPTSLDEAEDFAVHILGCILAKKTAGLSNEGIEKVFNAFHDKILKAILEYREHYSFALAWGVVSKRHMEK